MDVTAERTGERGARTGPVLDGRALAVAVGVPVLAVAAVVGMDAWLGDRLGDVVVQHWDGSGRPDGWGDRGAFVATMATVTGLTGLGTALVAGFARVWTALRRALLAIGVWCSVVVGGAGVESLLVQRDGAEGVSPPSTWLALALVGLVAAALAWRAPRDLVPPVLASEPPAADLPRSTADGVPAHPIGLGGRLEVTDGVLVVRWLGGAAVRIPAAEVVGAEVTRLSPWDLGGWGLRTQGGGVHGFVGRGSTAVEVRRADGMRWLVTTPRADDVAGVLNAAADRHHARTPSGRGGPTS